MASSVNHSTYRSGSSHAARRGVQGLASGLDVPELVKGMTVSSRAKIAKLNQEKQMIGWKAEAYWNVTDRLKKFQNKFMDRNASDSLFSRHLFENNSIVSKGKYADKVSVTGNLQEISDFKISSIEKLAKKASHTGEDVSNNFISTSELNFDTEHTYNALAGTKMGISYDGTKYEFKIKNDFHFGSATTDEQRMEKLKEAIEASIQDSELKDKVSISIGRNKEGKNVFVLEEKTGKIAKLEDGNYSLYRALGFNRGALINGNGKLESQKEPKLQDQQESITLKNGLKGKSIEVSLNGTSKKITFAENYNTIEELKNALNTEIGKSFGSKIKVETAGQRLKFELTDVNDTSSILKISAYQGVVGSAFGLGEGLENRVNMGQKLSEVKWKQPLSDYNITINGKDFQFTQEDTVGDVVKKINESDLGLELKYLKTMDKFVITSKEYGEDIKIEIPDGELKQALFGNGNSAPIDVKGENAVFTFQQDGIEQKVSRNSNLIDIDGLKVSLKGTFQEVGQEVSFEGNVRSEDVTKQIKEMVKEYNDILNFVQKETAERPDRSYRPLTDEQKQEMSEKEIEKWEEKAKQGILYAESDLNVMVSDMKAVFQSPDLLFDLQDMGLKISQSWQDKGKLEFDEAKFKQYYEANSDKVKELFTGEKSVYTGVGKEGVMSRLNSVTDKYAASVGTTKGILVEKAGMKGSYSYGVSRLAKQIEGVDKDIATAKEKLKRQEDRFYSRFTQLEKFMAKMNAQSGWLQSQFGA